MFKDLADIIYIEIYERITNKDIIFNFTYFFVGIYFSYSNYTADSEISQSACNGYDLKPWKSPVSKDICRTEHEIFT